MILIQRKPYVTIVKVRRNIRRQVKEVTAEFPLKFEHKIFISHSLKVPQKDFINSEAKDTERKRSRNKNYNVQKGGKPQKAGKRKYKKIYIYIKKHNKTRHFVDFAWQAMKSQKKKEEEMEESRRAAIGFARLMRGVFTERTTNPREWTTTRSTIKVDTAAERQTEYKTFVCIQRQRTNAFS